MTEPVTVWIVDDDSAIRFVLERALGRAGYKTRSFENVASVEAALDSGHPPQLRPQSGALDTLSTVLRMVGRQVAAGFCLWSELAERIMRTGAVAETQTRYTGDCDDSFFRSGPGSFRIPVGCL